MFKPAHMDANTKAYEKLMQMQADIDKLKADVWGTQMCPGSLPKMRALLQAQTNELMRLRSHLETKRPERWHEVFMEVLRNVPITGEGWAKSGVEWAKAAADAAYPPPSAAEEKVK